MKSKHDDSLFYLLNVKDLDNDNFNFGDEVSEYLKITLQFHLNPFTVNYAISEMMRDKKLKLLYDILKFQYLNKNTLAVLLEHKTIQKLMINVGLERELSSYELGILKEKFDYNFKFYGPEFVKFAKKYSIKLPSTIEYIDGIHMIDISSEGKLSWKFNTPSDAEMTFKKICTENNQLEIENYRTLLLKHLNDKNIKTFAKVKLIKAFFNSSELSPFIDSIKEYISKNLDSDKEIFNLAQYIALNGNYKKFTYADYDLFIALIKYKENKNIYSKILSINYSELPISNNFIDKQYVDFNVFFNCDLGRYFEVLKTMLEKREMEDNNLINRMEKLRLVNSAYRDFIVGRLWNYLGNTNYSVSANTLLGYSTAFSSFAPNDLKKFSDAAICLLNSNYNSASQSPYTAFNIALVLSDEIKPSIEVFSTNFNYDILRSLLEKPNIVYTLPKNAIIKANLSKEENCMFEAYKYYWENAFKYRATSTRADFWWPVLVNFIIFVILYFLLAIAGFTSVTSIMNGYNHGVGFLIFLLFVIAVFAIAIIIPGIAICVRRVRDTGLTGWTVLVFWLLSLIFTSNDSAVMETISSVIDIIFLVILCLPTGYVSKHGWWSANYGNDITVPSLRNDD